MKTILLVDDDEHICRTLVSMILAGGFDAITAKNGREALERLASRPVDMVIMDMIMPEMEGVETILKLRQEQHELPIIAISGGSRLSSKDCLQMAKALGASGTLAKPFTCGDLLNAIETVLNDPPRADDRKEIRSSSKSGRDANALRRDTVTRDDLSSAACK